MKTTITARDVAARLNKSRDTIWRYCREGIIPHKRIANTLLFDADEIDRWLDANSRGPAVPRFPV